MQYVISRNATMAFFNLPILIEIPIHIFAVFPNDLLIAERITFVF